MFDAIPIEALPQDPLFWATAVVAVFGLLVHYLYSGFIEANYKHIKWFRRLFLPHMTMALRYMDEEIQEYDLSRLYVETDVSESERVLDVHVGPNDYHYVLRDIEEFLMERSFRPEVLLASLADNPDKYTEIGNWVLTAPEKKHPSVPVLGKLHGVLLLLFAKWQLHVRIYYDTEKDLLRFYVHKERNPYNPFQAQKHYGGDGLDPEQGKRLFRQYLPELNDGPLLNHEYEVVHQ